MSDHRRYSHVENTAQHCRLGLFHDSDFAGGLEDSRNRPQEDFCAYLEVIHSYQEVGCARRTLILTEILKTQSRHQGETCVSSEVERSLPEVGCGRSKLQSHTVRLNLKLCFLDAGPRMDGIPALDLGDFGY